MKKLLLASIFTCLSWNVYAQDASAPAVEQHAKPEAQELSDKEARQIELENIPMIQQMMVMGGTAYMMGDIHYGSHEENQLLQLSTLTLSIDKTSPASKAYAYGVIATYYHCSNKDNSDEAKKQIYKTVMNDNSVKMSERKSIVTAYYKLINQRSCKEVEKAQAKKPVKKVVKKSTTSVKK